MSNKHSNQKYANGTPKSTSTRPTTKRHLRTEALQKHYEVQRSVAHLADVDRHRLIDGNLARLEPLLLAHSDHAVHVVALAPLGGPGYGDPNPRLLARDAVPFARDDALQSITHLHFFQTTVSCVGTLIDFFIFYLYSLALHMFCFVNRTTAVT